MMDISNISQITAIDDGIGILEGSFWPGGLWGYRSSDVLDTGSRRRICQPGRVLLGDASKL